MLLLPVSSFCFSLLLYKYLIFCKERPLERPTIFWRTKLIPKRRSLHVTLFAWWDAPRDALCMAGTLFFAEKLRKSRKNSEFRQISAFFAEKLGFSQIFSEKFAFFRKKNRWCVREKNNYFRENKNSKSVFDALCARNMQRASGTLFT